MPSPIRFDHFMERALHHPEHGYYARNINTVGKTGDFSTSATLSPILGKAIAATFQQYLQQNNKPPAHIIEIGAGDASLAATLLQSLPFAQRLKTHYHIVDSSSPLRTKQKHKLRFTRLISTIKWHTEIESALNSCDGNAFIFSNELVDAFPVRILKKSNNVWLELHLDGTNETFLPCPDPPDSCALTHHPENQRIEIHHSYHQWLQQWIPIWKHGQLLTIDYGDIYPDIYYRRPHGSLRGYSHHQRITGQQLYHHPGSIDLTADVNFTDLQLWGKQLGLKNIHISSQTDFLTPHATDTAADQYLIDPYGPGSAFKVLLQQRIQQ